MALYRPTARAVLTVVFDGQGADDSKPKLFTVVPKRAEIIRNSYRQADSWSLTFDALDFPVDPQQVRGGTADVFIFHTEKFESDTRLFDQERGTFSGLLANRKPSISGPWDDHNIEYSESGRWVTLSGQDYTAILAGKQWPPTDAGTARRIPTGRGLDVILTEILAMAIPQHQLRLVVEGLTDLPNVGKDESKTNGRGIPIEQDTSYWDVMYKLATRHGCILFVRGNEVVLTRPKNLEDAKRGKVKRIAWGKNLEHLRMERRLNIHERSPRIIVHGWDPKKREIIRVEYPDTKLKKKAREFKPSEADQESTVEKLRTSSRRRRTTTETVTLEDQYKVVTIFGISDPVVLQQAAKSMYLLLGKGERVLTARTRDLQDLDGNDMLDITAGDAVRVEWDDAQSLRDPNLTQEQRYARLTAAGFSPSVAGEISKNYNLLLGNDRPMRFQEGTIEYDADEGISIEMQLWDFVVVDGIRDGSQKERAA